METNVCSIDRMVRLALGVVLAVVGVAAVVGALGLGATVGGVALVVGLVLLATGGMQLCPLYSLLGIDTCGN